MVMILFVSMATVKIMTVCVKRATLDPTVTNVGFVLCVYCKAAYRTLKLSHMVCVKASFVQHYYSIQPH